MSAASCINDSNLFIFSKILELSFWVLTIIFFLDLDFDANAIASCIFDMLFETSLFTVIDFGFRLPSALDNRPLKFSEIEQYFKDVIFVSATPSDYEYKNSNLYSSSAFSF